jgi:drug/metabolite transporter (DMT)-like permease
MNKTVQSHLALFTANLIYAANFSIAKDVMPKYIQPFGFILLRVSGALLLYWLVASVATKDKMERKDVPRAILCGLFGIAINQLLFFKGLNITTPINAAIMMVCTPLLVVIISAFLIREKMRPVKILGVMLGLAGAVSLILLHPAHPGSFGKSTLPGDICVLVNATSWAIYLVIVRPLMIKYDTLTVIKWAFLFGFIFVLPFGYSDLRAVQWGTMTNSIVWEVIFVVVATTFFAYLFNTFALKHVSASVVSIYIYLQPLLAALIAVSLGKDELNAVKIISTVLIFVGVYLVSYSPAKIQKG